MMQLCSHPHTHLRVNVSHLQPDVCRLGSHPSQPVVAQNSQHNHLQDQIPKERQGAKPQLYSVVKRKKKQSESRRSRVQDLLMATKVRTEGEWYSSIQEARLKRLGSSRLMRDTTTGRASRRASSS